MSIEELGQIRTESNLKTTINLTLVDESDFDADKLEKYFDKKHFLCEVVPNQSKQYIREKQTRQWNYRGS